MPIPTFQTARLTIGPFLLADGPAVQKLAGHPEIARTTAHIPHPYPDGAAEKWIATHHDDFEEGTGVVFAIRETGGSLIGAIGLTIDRENRRAELGYWLGLPFWGHGYCTEAARRVVEYGFHDLGLQKIHAHHLGGNPASGRVMEKIGMTREGCLRQHIWKNGVFDDFVAWSILRDEFPAVSPFPTRQNPPPSAAS